MPATGLPPAPPPPPADDPDDACGEGFAEAPETRDEDLPASFGGVA